MSTTFSPVAMDVETGVAFPTMPAVGPPGFHLLAKPSGATCRSRRFLFAANSRRPMECKYWQRKEVFS